MMAEYRKQGIQISERSLYRRLHILEQQGIIQSRKFIEHNAQGNGFRSTIWWQKESDG